MVCWMVMDQFYVLKCNVSNGSKQKKSTVSIDKSQIGWGKMGLYQHVIYCINYKDLNPFITTLIHPILFLSNPNQAYQSSWSEYFSPFGPADDPKDDSSANSSSISSYVSI